MNRLAPSPTHQDSSAAPIHAAVLQRKCDCGQHTIGGSQCFACQRERTNLQRAANDATPASHGNNVPQIVHEVLSSPGQPLDTATREFFEPRFGHDFSAVRIHTDTRAAESARAVDAFAYTVGADLAFASAQYAPTTEAGKRLLAHELAHVVQQRQSPAASGQQASLTISQAGDAAEIEADAIADHVVSGPDVSPPLQAQSATLQRAITVPITSSHDPGAQACLVHLHGDEQNAYQTAQGIHNDFCSTFTRLGSSTRCVDVGIPGSHCTADPNRIFSDEAIDGNHPFTGECGCEPAAHRAAKIELKRYRRQLENAIGQCRGGGGSGIDGPLPVVAFHNNDPHGSLSINYYRPGEPERAAVDTSRLPRTTPNPSILTGRGPDPHQLRDPDNFLLVTQPSDFTTLRNQFNIVLQGTTAESVRPGFDDGSLSVRLRNQRFINIEAQEKTFRGTSDPTFITNRLMADEVMAHMRVPRRRAAGAPCAAPRSATGVRSGGQIQPKRSGASAPVRASAGNSTQVLARQVIGGRPPVQLPRQPPGEEPQEQPKLEQPRTPRPSPAPAPLPRPAPTRCITDTCRTFRNLRELRPIKDCWRAIIDRMARADREGVANWFIGVNRPPAGVTDEFTLQSDCMLAALSGAAGARGSGITVPARPARDPHFASWRASGYRDFPRQANIWRRKFNFELEHRPDGTMDCDRTVFDRITPAARALCGPTLLPTAEIKWNPAEPRHRLCWHVGPLPGEPPLPAMPADATRQLTENERQVEILEASSAPGISRHHWGTDFDLFDVNPQHWRSPAERAASAPSPPAATGGSSTACAAEARATGPGRDLFGAYEWLAGRSAVAPTTASPGHSATAGTAAVPGHAAQYGFMQSFTSTSRGAMGYMEERWHWSYYPVAQALLEWFRDRARTPTGSGTVAETNRDVVRRLLMRRWPVPAAPPAPAAGSPAPPPPPDPFSHIRPNWEAFIEHVNETPRFTP